MLLGKKQAGSAPGHTWEHDGDVQEVDDALALELLAIPDGGFYEAPTGKGASPAPDPAETQATELDESPAGKAGATPGAKRPAARSGKPTTASAGPQDAPPSADVVAE